MLAVPCFQPLVGPPRRDPLGPREASPRARRFLQEVEERIAQNVIAIQNGEAHEVFQDLQQLSHVSRPCYSP